jgi:hypothetical protein
VGVLGEAVCILGLGDIALGWSDHDWARARYDEALPLYQRIREPYAIGQSHRRLARLATTPADRGRHLRAAQEVWMSIRRDDLLRELHDEFGESQILRTEGQP